LAQGVEAPGAADSSVAHHVPVLLRLLLLQLLLLLLEVLLPLLPMRPVL